MHRIHLVVLTLPTLLIACGGTSSIDAIRNGIPSSDTVHMNFPGAGTALTADQAQQAAQGDPSGFYAITRLATLWVNGGTLLVLGLVKAITDNPPTSFSGHVAVWGPYTDPLSPNTWRLTVTDHGGNHYSYVLEGKAKWDPDTAYVAVLSGTHNPATDSSGHPIRGYGNGTFLIDWDNAHTLPEHDNNVGTAAFSYSRMTATDRVEIDVTFTQVWDWNTNPPTKEDANYKYVQTPGADGLFQFSTYRATSTGAIQRMAIESRWNNSGAGRSDVIVTGGSLTQPATVNECWDQFFKSQYLNVSYDPSQDYGSESSCAFIPAEYSPL
jgi:hypothetical protein